jgi:preprotein translocase subunit YajC
MILLQAAGAGNNFAMPLLMVGMFVVMYFFMIRPQQQKAKEQVKMVDSLKAGDDVITAGGLHGKVLSTDDKTVTISAGGGARLTFEKTSISRKV